MGSVEAWSSPDLLTRQFRHFFLSGCGVRVGLYNIEDLRGGFRGGGGGAGGRPSFF